VHGLCKIVLVTKQSKDGHNILGTLCQTLPTSAAMCIQNDVQDVSFIRVTRGKHCFFL